MSEETSKTYVFGNDKGSVDPSTLLAMMNNNGGFGGNGNWLWIIFLFFLYGWRGNAGLGNFGDCNQSNGVDLLMQAMGGNRDAIGNLATTLNCDINAIQTAINAVQTSIQSVGSQVGMSGQQIINAIQSGNQTLASQLAQCCCDNKLLVTQQGYENRIANAEQTAILGGKIDGSTTAITSAIANQTTLINDKFCQLEMRDMKDKLDALTAQNTALQNSINNANQTAQIQGYINSVITPLQKEVSSIKAAQPPTVSVPYPQLMAVPQFYGNGFLTNPFNINGSIWS